MAEQKLEPTADDQAQPAVSPSSGSNNIPNNSIPGSPPPAASGSSAYISNPFMVFIESFKKVFTVNFGTLAALFGIILATIAVVILMAVIWGMVISGAGDSMGTRVIGGLFFIVLLVAGFIWLFVLLAAFMKYAIETARERTISFGEVFKVGRKKWLGYFGVSFLVALAVFGGLILLIVPGIIFAYWFFFSGYIFIDQDTGVIEAMKRSKQFVKGKGWEVFGMFGANFVFGLPGYFPILGMLYSLVYSPLSQIAFAYRYTSGRTLEQSGQPKPKTHTANYIAVAIIPALIVLFIILAVAFGDGSGGSRYESDSPYQFDDYEYQYEE